MTVQREPRIVLFHSNDIHSRLENAARIASAITEERNLLGDDRLLVIDCGDHMDRMREETEGTNGNVNIALLNEAKYDVITLGNNEGLTFAREDLSQTYNQQTSFSIICANLYHNEDDSLPQWLQQKIIVTKSGLKIGLTAATANYEDVYKLLGWKTTEPFQAIKEQVELLRQQVDIMIVISHLGLPADKQLAEQINGIDLILGAHTHHLLEEALVINETTICAAGKFGEYVGRIAIDFNEDTKRPLFDAKVIQTASLKEKPEQIALIEKYKRVAGEKLSRVITTLKAPLSMKLESETDLPNLLAISLKKWMGADIGLVNNGQLLGGLSQGHVTAGDIHALCPSPINPCLMELKGSDIRIALEQSLQEEFIFKPIKGFGFRGEKLGSLAVAGMTITYNPQMPYYEQIVQININGEPLQADHYYKVGTIDMFSFRVGYESLANARFIHFFMPEFIRNLIEEESANEQSLQACKRKNWSSLLQSLM